MVFYCLIIIPCYLRLNPPAGLEDWLTFVRHVWRGQKSLCFPTNIFLECYHFLLELISPTCLCSAFMCTNPKCSKRESCHNFLFALFWSSSIKAPCKMLVKFTPGVNFINISGTAFMCTNPKCAKRESCHNCLFVLFLSLSIKYACKMLVKFTPGVNFTNILHATYTCADPKSIKKAVGLTNFFFAF